MQRTILVDLWCGHCWWNVCEQPSVVPPMGTEEADVNLPDMDVWPIKKDI